MNAPTSAFAKETSLPVTRLDGAEVGQIQEWLGSFARHAKAHEVALLDPTGAVLVRWAGSEPREDLDSLGVLAGASFCAMKSLAERLGDRNFGGICHQGAKHSLYLAPLASGYMLLMLREADVSIEEMRHSLLDIVPRLNQRLVNKGSPVGKQGSSVGKQAAPNFQY